MTRSRALEQFFDDGPIAQAGRALTGQRGPARTTWCVNLEDPLPGKAPRQAVEAPVQIARLVENVKADWEPGQHGPLDILPVTPIDR